MRVSLSYLLCFVEYSGAEIYIQRTLVYVFMHTLSVPNADPFLISSQWYNEGASHYCIIRGSQSQ